MRFIEIRRTVVKQFKTQGVSELHLATPSRISAFTSVDKQIIKPEFEHLKNHIFVPTQNRRYRRAMRKPFKPNNLRRQTRTMKEAWDNV